MSHTLLEFTNLKTSLFDMELVESAPLFGNTLATSTKGLLFWDSSYHSLLPEPGICGWGLVQTGQIFIGQTADLAEYKIASGRRLVRGIHPCPLLNQAIQDHGIHNFVYGVLPLPDQENAEVNGLKNSRVRLELKKELIKKMGQETIKMRHLRNDTITVLPALFNVMSNTNFLNENLAHEIRKTNQSG